MTSPDASRIMPDTIITIPLMFHSGLAYINEDSGPTTDALWSMKISPNPARTTPVMMHVLAIPFADCHIVILYGLL